MAIYGDVENDKEIRNVIVALKDALNATKSKRFLRPTKWF